MQEGILNVARVRFVPEHALLFLVRVCSLVDSASGYRYQLLFSEEKRRLAFCPVVGDASLPGRESAWVGH